MADLETVNKELSLEEALDKVDKTLERLGKDIPLEESFALYKEGIELLKFCDDKLKNVEQLVQMINEEGELNEFQ
ncbi:MAG: exodeoxyribonuclease VII small subunit [Lachnospiraceae bacterium]|nr:exodeoxyribonuclease VII small subunit [Lachnospiraceae bacterium]